MALVTRVSSPVLQLCYAYNLTMCLKGCNESTETLKQQYDDARPFCNRVIAALKGTDQTYTDVFAKADANIIFDYQWLPNVNDLIRHLSFQDEAVGFILVETMHSPYARSIGLIGHEFSSRTYTLVDPKAGVVFKAANLDGDVRSYITSLNVPDTTGYVYCTPVAQSASELEAETSVGDSVDTTTKKRELESTPTIEPVRRKRPTLRKKPLAIPVVDAHLENK